MKKTIATLAMAAMISVGFVAGPAAAKGGKSASAPGQCISAGLGALTSLDLVDDVARGEFDFSAIADAEEGPIFADLPEGSNLKLPAVIALHKSNPELFAWCR